MNRVLLLGSGGRESAMLMSILQSPSVEICLSSALSQGFAHEKFIYCDLDFNNFPIILAIVNQFNINFVIVGTEEPLCNGVVDFLEENGVAVYGPTQNAALLEGSKIFMKDILEKAGVPTAKYQAFSCKKIQEAIEFAKSLGEKVVIKTDGLAGGKGVYICENIQEVDTVLQSFLHGKFGSAGENVIIEEFLDGKEASIFALCDGKKAIPFFHACDYKKIGEGDTGLNTGGMGSFAPSFLTNKEFEEIVEKYFNATMQELTKRGVEYKGFLFGGIIKTSTGIKFLEYNVRMGDPETQSILPLFDGDFVETLRKSCNGTLIKSDIKFLNKKSVSVVLASKGYPVDFPTGKEISGIENANCNIFLAGIKTGNGKIFTNGGRVMALNAIAENFEIARNEVYKNIAQIHFDGKYFRKDIAK